jgi:hypothetical protein
MASEMNQERPAEQKVSSEALESHSEVAEVSEDAQREASVAEAKTLQEEARGDFSKMFDRFMEVKSVASSENSDAAKEELAQTAEKALEAQILILEHEDMLRDAQAESGAGRSANELLERLADLEPIVTTGIKVQIEARMSRAESAEEKARLGDMLARWSAARSGSNREASEIAKAVRQMRPGETNPYDQSSKLAHDLEGLAIKKKMLADRGSVLPGGDQKEFDRLQGILNSRIEKEGWNETLRGYEALLEPHFEKPAGGQ